MRKKEQALWDTLKRHAPSSLWLQRIENLVGEGMPDVYSGSTDKWVELKAPSAKIRDTTPVLGSEGLRTSQVNWHLKRASFPDAAPSFILVRAGGSGELYLVPGRLAPLINAMGRASLRQASLASTWEQIIEVLQQ